MPRAHAAARPTGRRGAAWAARRRPRMSTTTLASFPVGNARLPRGRPEHAPRRARRACRCSPACDGRWSGRRRPRVGTAVARSSADASGPCSTVTTRPTTASSPPTWSRSKWVSTSRSMRATPTRSRQAAERLRRGSGVDRARRRPRSGAGRRRPGRRRTRARSTPTAASSGPPTEESAAPPPTTPATIASTTIATAMRVPRRAAPPGAERSDERPDGDARERRAAATPGQPSSQGTGSPGSALKVSAVPAIHDAGSQASAARPAWSQGSGAARQAASPTTVATRRRRRGEEIREHAVHRHARGDQHQERTARELGGERHRQRESESTRHPSLEACGKRAGEQQQRRRRGRREREAERAGQPRVGHEEHGDGEREHGHARAGAAEQHAEHRDAGHRAGAHDARLGRDQQHEAGERGEPDADPRAARSARRRDGAEGEPDDERAVRTGHGGQVRQRRLLHRRVELRRSRPRCRRRRAPGSGPRRAPAARRPTRRVRDADRPRRRALRAAAAVTSTPRDAVTASTARSPAGTGAGCSARLDQRADIECFRAVDVRGLHPDRDVEADRVGDRTRRPGESRPRRTRIRPSARSRPCRPPSPRGRPRDRR